MNFLIFREVNWGKGVSSRFLLEEDGYPISVTHSSYKNEESVKLEYDEFLKVKVIGASMSLLAQLVVAELNMANI